MVKCNSRGSPTWALSTRPPPLQIVMLHLVIIFFFFSLLEYLSNKDLEHIQSWYPLCWCFDQMTMTHLAVTLMTTVGDSTVPCSIRAGVISPCTSRSSSLVTWCDMLKRDLHSVMVHQDILWQKQEKMLQTDLLPRSYWQCKARPRSLDVTTESWCCMIT